jgi:hypothetical protein
MSAGIYHMDGTSQARIERVNGAHKFERAIWVSNGRLE